MNSLGQTPGNFSTHHTSVKNAKSVQQELSKIPEVKEEAQQSELHHLPVKSDQIPISAGNVARSSEEPLKNTKTKLNQTEKFSSTQTVTQTLTPSAAPSAEKIANIPKSFSKINVERPASERETKEKKTNLKNTEPQSQPQAGIKSKLDFAQDIASQQEDRISDKVSKKLASFEKGLNQLLSKEVMVAKQILGTLSLNLTSNDLEGISNFLGCESDEFENISPEFAKNFLKQILINSSVDEFIKVLGDCECYQSDKSQKTLELITSMLNTMINDFTNKFDAISNLYRDVKLEGIQPDTDISKQYSSGVYNLLEQSHYNVFIESLLSEGVKNTMKTLDDTIRPKIEAFKQERNETPEMREYRATDPETYVQKINQEYELYSETIPERKSERKQGVDPEKHPKIDPEVWHRTYSKILNKGEIPKLTTSSYKMPDYKDPDDTAETDETDVTAVTAETYLDYTHSTTAERAKMSLESFEIDLQNQFDQRLENAIRGGIIPKKIWLDELTVSLKAYTDQYLVKQQINLDDNPIHSERYEGVLKMVVDRNEHDLSNKVLEIRIKVFAEQLFDVVLETAKDAIDKKIKLNNKWLNEIKGQAEIQGKDFIEQKKNLTDDDKIKFMNFFNNYLDSKLKELKFKLVDNYVTTKITQALRQAEELDSDIDENWFQDLESQLVTSLDTFLKYNNFSKKQSYMELLSAQINKYESEYLDQSDDEFPEIVENE